MSYIVLALVAVGLFLYLWQVFPAFKWVMAAIVGIPVVLIGGLIISSLLEQRNRQDEQVRAAHAVEQREQESREQASRDQAQQAEALSSFLASAKDITHSAVVAALNNTSSPRPSFDTIDARLVYLRWLGQMNSRLKPYDSDPLRRLEFLETAWYESTRAGLDPTLILALVESTSRFKRYAVNASGARGYMAVATHWSQEIGDGDPKKLFHLQVNLRYGCVVLRHYLDAYRGDINLALNAYYSQMQGLATQQSADSNAFVDVVLEAQRRWLQ